MIRLGIFARTVPGAIAIVLLFVTGCSSEDTAAEATQEATETVQETENVDVESDMEVSEDADDDGDTQVADVVPEETCVAMPVDEVTAIISTVAEPKEPLRIVVDEDYECYLSNGNNQDWYVKFYPYGEGELEDQCNTSLVTNGDSYAPGACFGNGDLRFPTGSPDTYHYLGVRFPRGVRVDAGDEQSRDATDR